MFNRLWALVPLIVLEVRQPGLPDRTYRIETKGKESTLTYSWGPTTASKKVNVDTALRITSQIPTKDRLKSESACRIRSRYRLTLGEDHFQFCHTEQPITALNKFISDLQIEMQP